MTTRWNPVVDGPRYEAISQGDPDNDRWAVWDNEQHRAVIVHSNEQRAMNEAAMLSAEYERVCCVRPFIPPTSAP